MKQYLDVGRQLIEKYERTQQFREDRTKVNTVSGFGNQLRFNLRDGFPLVTTKQVPFKTVAKELLWFLKGSTDVEELKAVNCHIWDEWALEESVYYEARLVEHARVEEAIRLGLTPFKTRVELRAHLDYLTKHGSTEEGHRFLDMHNVPRTVKYVTQNKGDLGPIYGKQWRSWPTRNGQGIDQIKTLMRNLVKHPFSRRHVISAWNTEYIPSEDMSPQENIKEGKMALAPCHVMFQFYVEEVDLTTRIAKLREMGYLAPSTYIEENKLLEWVDSFIHISPRYILSCQLYQRKQNCAFYQ